MNELRPLILQLIQSTYNFISPDIMYNKDKEAYLIAMSNGYSLCAEEFDVPYMLKELKKLRHDAPKKLLPRWGLFTNANRHYLLGLRHCIEIVDSINARFNTGHRHSDDIFVETIRRRIHEI